MVWQDLFFELYGQPGSPVLKELAARLEPTFTGRPVSAAIPAIPFSERDVLLITYPDQIRQAGEVPLRTLADFCERRFTGLISHIHVLPFFPASSDDGFAIADYRTVDTRWGVWEDLSRLGTHFHLMFDAVINHASASSHWFHAFLDDRAPYRGFFFEPGPDFDFSRVVRPRTSPVVHSYPAAGGSREVWTTFSADQPDLNYRNPAVMAEIIDLLLFYLDHGASILRLDAIAYLWKESGTVCIHLPQTHTVVRLLRAVLDRYAPGAKLITETNAPHRENISYFGDGRNETHLVYNFALPPLVLHTLQTGDAEPLSRWAGTLAPPSDQTAFLNFLASHDGIGLEAVRGILPEAAIDALVRRTLERGGRISSKQDRGGRETAYEMNINYFDALSEPGEKQMEWQIRRFLAAHAILFSLAGLPGIYIHSLLGSRGWQEGAAQTGIPRAINRQKLIRENIERELADGKNLRSRIFTGLSNLIRARAGSPAFHGQAGQKVLSAGKEVFGLLRESQDGSERILCLQNVTGQPVDFQPDPRIADLAARPADLLTGAPVPASADCAIHLAPYQSCWLRLNPERDIQPPSRSAHP